MQPKPISQEYPNWTYPSEQQILLQIWRWKVVSSMGMSLYLTGKPKAEFPYRKLVMMQSKGLVSQVVGSDGRKTMWTLSRDGYRSIRHCLPELKQDGHRAEYPRHDFICSGLQFASLLAFPEDGIEAVSEQELRRYSISSYPSWTPTDEDHRSDGYWCIPKGGKLKLVSLEVELSHQSHDKYRRIGNFYHRNDHIEEVLWIFKNQCDAKGCLKSINRFLKMDAKYHRFTTLAHLIDSGWDAPTFFLHRDQTKPHQKLIRSISASTPNADLRDFLNLRKCHFSSSSYLFPN